MKKLAIENTFVKERYYQFEQVKTFLLQEMKASYYATDSVAFQDFNIPFIYGNVSFIWLLDCSSDYVVPDKS